MNSIRSLKLLIIALVVSHNIFSQSNVYRPFPGGSAIWHVSRQSMSGINYYNYKTSGDTLVGSYNYKKVLYAYNVTPGPFNFSPYTFKFGYRNDSLNKKVYYLDVTGGINKDTLWYDYNLNVGDTLKSTYSYYRSISNPRIVQAIDSILICGSYNKRFKFNCTDNESALVEGAGFMDNFVQTSRDNECPFEPTYVYSTSFSTCYITSIGAYANNKRIELFPNPAVSELKINSSVKMLEYSIINTIGEIVLNGNIADSQHINVSSLGDGLYTIKMQDKSGKQYQSKFIKQ